MTVLRSLRSRILLARMAAQLPLTQAGDRLPELAAAGVDMALLTAGDFVDRKKGAQIFQDLRRRFGQQVLLAVDTPRIEADVRVLPPGDEDRSRPHQWALLGQMMREREQITHPGKAFQFLIIPGTVPGSPLLREAMASQSPLLQDTLPWFAAGALDVDSVQALADSGIRRIWLTGRRSVGELERIDEILRRAWGEDPAYEDYLDFAIRA